MELINTEYLNSKEPEDDEDEDEDDDDEDEDIDYFDGDRNRRGQSASRNSRQASSSSSSSSSLLETSFELLVASHIAGHRSKYSPSSILPPSSATEEEAWYAWVPSIDDAGMDDLADQCNELVKKFENSKRPKRSSPAGPSSSPRRRKFDFKSKS